VLADNERDVVQESMWSIQSDATFDLIMRDLLSSQPADLNMVYFGGPDVVGHRFWRQSHQDDFEWASTPEADEILSHVIPNYYRWIDELIGGLVAAGGPEMSVMVISDHGMHGIGSDVRHDRNTGHHPHAPDGVLLAAGPGFVIEGGIETFLRSGALATQGAVTNVASTVLALLGIPGATDMTGPAWRSILAPGAARDAATPSKMPLLATHDDGFRLPENVPTSSERDESFLERYRALGYMGGEDIPADDEPDAAPVGDGDADSEADVVAPRR